MATVIAVAYPLLDVVALSVLIRLLVGVERLNPALALLTVSVALTLTADLIFNSLAAQGIEEDAPVWVEVLFLAAVLSDRRGDRAGSQIDHQAQRGHPPHQGSPDRLGFWSVDGTDAAGLRGVGRGWADGTPARRGVHRGDPAGAVGRPDPDVDGRATGVATVRPRPQGWPHWTAQPPHLGL